MAEDFLNFFLITINYLKQVKKSALHDGHRVLWLHCCVIACATHIDQWWFYLKGANSLNHRVI